MPFRHALLLVTALTVACGLPAAQADDTLQNIANRVASHQDWIAEAQTCPADLMRERESRGTLSAGDCKTTQQFETCLTACEAGDSGACYWLAAGVQAADNTSSATEPLYQRACKLGYASGCTNRAAGMLAVDVNDTTVHGCTSRSFQKACDQDDPWACSMFALHLSRGMGMPKDLGKALEALEKSCTHGQEDPACSKGMQLKSRIEQEQAGTARKAQ